MAVDGARLDRIARAVASTGTRRALLRWVAGGLAGVTLAMRRLADGAAQTVCEPGTFSATG